jgi:mannose-1-phosphate guanylyltransferase/mannose-6-phosphate isomerase
MIVVIIAGGSGTRLWPLSTPNYPKPLMRVNGDRRSLLQNTYERAKLLSENVLVITEASHAEHVQKQLADLPEHRLIIEPARRGTQNCVVAALAELQDVSDDEQVVFMPADHYVRDTIGFVQSFKVAAAASARAKKIVLIGVEPDHPATGFGYIKKGPLVDSTGFVYQIDSFTEKPAYNTAQKYLNSGLYLWSCSYFIGSISLFIDAMRQYSPNAYNNYTELKRVAGTHSAQTAKTDAYNKIYLNFKPETFEYGVIERISKHHLLVVPAQFDWMDLGSYADLHKVVDSDNSGNHSHGTIASHDTSNSFMQNYEQKPLVVIGLDNVVVVNTEHGTLVVRKDLAQKVGEVSKDLPKNSKPKKSK